MLYPCYACSELNSCEVVLPLLAPGTSAVLMGSWCSDQIRDGIVFRHMCSIPAFHGKLCSRHD